MSKDEWYSKLNKWAHEDSRLERMPLVYLRALAEHIANEQAVEQSVQADGAYCVCPQSLIPVVGNAPAECPYCHQPRR